MGGEGKMIDYREALWAYLVVLFKQHNTYFHDAFSTHVFPQYLNNVTKTTLLNRP